MSPNTFTLTITAPDGRDIARLDVPGELLASVAPPDAPVTPAPEVKTKPLRERARFGAYVYEGVEGKGGRGGAWDPGPHQQLETNLGRTLDPVSSFVGWDVTFAQIPLAAYGTRDHLISWHPDGTTAKRILAGVHDEFLTTWAKQAQKWTRSKLYVRLMPEFNGNWAYWSPLRTERPTLGIRSAAEWKAVYRHVHDLVSDIAPNIKWVWCPNITDEPYQDGNHLEYFYPGNDYVDIAAFDGYNWGTSDGGKWVSFRQLVGEPIQADPNSIYDRLKLLTGGKPIWICEISTAEGATKGDKGRWIEEMLNETGFPLVEAIIFFSVNKERDWRLDASDAAIAVWKK